MNGCTENQFELHKIKVLNSGAGVNVEFGVRRDECGAQVLDKYIKESVTYPHPDLLKAVGDLKDSLMKSTGHYQIIDEAYIDNSTAFKSPKAKEEFIEEATEKEAEERKRVTVTGISVSGDEKNRGAVITGTYLCQNGSKIALNSPRIRFAANSLGFEGAVEECCKEIETEAYLYVFKDKQAQQEIVFEGDEGEEKD